MSEEATHPLNTPWTFWVNSLAEKATADYSDSTIVLGKVDTVESFWSKLKTIPRPTELCLNIPGVKYQVDRSPVAALNLFRHSIQPEWEDEKNKDGGEFRFAVRIGDINGCLKNVFFGCVGELIDEDGIMTGVRCVPPKPKQAGKSGRNTMYRIEFWYEGCGDDNDKVDKLKHNIENFLRTEVKMTGPINLEQRFHSHAGRR
eukprot:TRINITY_DN2333_c0_g1_i1.p1 TRINITY_DN2333_c0_g1~~TRINITY_DN2333_c0_g1_i1.p1  ORF type:complete len:225 (+),score=36.33 TRINITY_DN2333_c0_g1_i1:71-676(+)